MVISADAVYDYLEAMEQADVRKEDLSPWHSVTQSEALMLMAAGCVEGRGSRSRLRFLRLLCTPEEARERAFTTADSLSRSNAKQVRLISLDALQRMAASRKFIIREQCFVEQDGVMVRSGRWTFAHKRPVPGFGCAAS